MSVRRYQPPQPAISRHDSQQRCRHDAGADVYASEPVSCFLRSHFCCGCGCGRFHCAVVCEGFQRIADFVCAELVKRRAQPARLD